MISSDEVEKDISVIIELADACRYIASYAVYVKLIESIEKESTSNDVRAYAYKKLKSSDTINLMIERAKDVQHALDYQDTSDDWVLGAVMFGITTHYKLCENDSVIVKMEGNLDELPILEQFAVIREVDLFSEWVPFCTKSEMVDKIGKAKLVPYVCMGLPLFSRDFLMRAYGADCLQEHGKVIILGGSIDDYPEKTVPWKEVGWFHNKMKITEFKTIIEITSTTSAKTMIISRVDLNAPLPASLINFLIRNLGGILLYLLQKQVVKVQKDPSCHHATRIRTDVDFYRDWVLPKFRHFCDLKGWEQPTVASLGADGIPPSSSIPMSSMAAAAEATDDDDVKKDLVLSSATVSDSGDSNGYEGDNTGKSILLPIASPIVVADKITM